MKCLYSKSLFLFRRDLRLEDNTGLTFARTFSETVIPAFIFTPEQIERNPYRGDSCLQFMIESLEDLEESLREKKGHLYLFFGNPDEVVEECIRRNKIDAVVVNREYTPYGIHRDQKIEAVCKSLGVSFHSFDDVLLHPPERIVKENGKPYTVFSSFFQTANMIDVSKPTQMRKGKFFCEKIALAHNRRLFMRILPERRSQAKGGRSSAIRLLRALGHLSTYSSEKDFPALESTTHLSPHLKFTTCSPREVYASIVRTLGKSSDLIRSLYWRDFFTSIGYFFPRVFGSSFYEKFDQFPWNYDKENFQRWCDGTTGFPIVDAGMRQLRETGELHNRVRMITASFLIKDLHIDWRWGERYFARSLLDYDPAVNNGNWQWIASTGCDAQPYFRIFNPWIQQRKYDPDCVYIKRWIPELKRLSSEAIHTWQIEESRSSYFRYPAPMLSHRVESQKTLILYKKHLKS